MFRHFSYLSLLMITVTSGLQSQYYFYDDNYYHSIVLVEAGLSIGGMNCLTDLGGKKGKGKPFLKDVNWENTHITGSIYLSVIYDQIFGLRAEVSFGKVSASDQVLKNDYSAAKSRYSRNLHFKSAITEGFLIAEIWPLGAFNKEKYTLLSPYLLAGVGVFKFNPQALVNGQWISLHPLCTEGQGFAEYPGKVPYRLTQVNFPTGLGIRYEVSALVTARLEVVYRFLQTDYLDDVSTQYINPGRFYTHLNVNDAAIAERLADRGSELVPGYYRHEGEIRGNPKNRDAYFSCNIKIGVILNRKRR